MSDPFAVGDLILNPGRIEYSSNSERAWARSHCMYAIILEKSDVAERDDVWMCLTKFYDDVCSSPYVLPCMTWNTQYLQYLSGE